MPADNPEYLDESLPEPSVLQTLGQISIAWGVLDTMSSAVLFSQLDMDPIEFSSLVGRLETQPKLQRLAKILKHRKSPLAETAKALASRVAKTKDLRNGITHGFYSGKSARREYFFLLLPDTLVEDGRDSAYEVLVVTDDELESHLRSVVAITTDLQQAFDSPKLRELTAPPARVGSRTLAIRGHIPKQR